MGIITVNTDFEKLFGITEREYYAKQYLTFECVSKVNWGYIELTIPAGLEDSITSISYSIDNGTSWTTMSYENEKIDLMIDGNPVDKKVLFKGIAKQYCYFNDTLGDDVYATFFSDVKFKVYGNIMSLFYGDDFEDKVVFPSNSSSNCANLFNNWNVLVDAENLILPATTLANTCYSGMFSGCTSLTTAPELPATTLADSCYIEMFRSCTSLTTAPELPATTLADDCYANMFSGCTSLTTAPELPATTLADDCYNYMFYECTSLTTAPELPATTLANYCYQSMFSGCTSLTTAPELPATTLANYCYSYMFNGCTSLNYVKCHLTGNINSSNTNNWLMNVAATGTFVSDFNANWDNGASGIPTGWTKKYFNGPSLVMYVDKFPPQGDTGIGDFNYEERTGMTRDEYMEATVAAPEDYMSDKYIYYGVTINIDNTTYNLWKGVGLDNSELFLLTTTADYDTLSAQSIAEEGDVPFTSMYALATSEDDEFDIYKVNAESKIPRQLVKIEQYSDGE